MGGRGAKSGTLNIEQRRENFKKVVQLNNYVKKSLNQRIGKLRSDIALIEKPIDLFAIIPAKVYERAKRNYKLNKKKLAELESEKKKTLKTIEKYRRKS